MVCARELPCTESADVVVEKIPNLHLLIPHKAHAAHVLTNGALLQRQALTQTTNGICRRICNECLNDLEKGCTPRLALANGMWTGEVPPQLTGLSVPEQYLISRHFSAAYIVKMFPKRKGAQSLNQGLRGNVSTYRLDTDEIAELVSDNVFPRPVKILASTIGVTFVGPKNEPERCYPGFLRIRRQRVRNALLWLKENNPLYTDIIISEERLEQVVEDGVPDEILCGMRYCDDIEAVDRERAGYVPEDDDFEMGVTEYEQGSGNAAGRCQITYYVWE